MARLLKKGDKGPEVKEIQTLLTEKGFLTNEEINGIFDNETHRAVRMFQAQNLDQQGQPLTVDGKVGELTWWSLHHPKPFIQTHSAVDFLQMPPENMGGSGRAALAAAISKRRKWGQTRLLILNHGCNHGAHLC